MEPKYPDFIYDKRPVYVKGMLHKTDPSERRIEDRKKLYNIICGSGTSLYKIDEMINYFRNKYEGDNWTGLGKKGRIQLFLKYKGRCMWCHEKLTITNFTVEHITPRIEGGTDDFDNLGIAHLECNNNRQNVAITKGGFYNDAYIEANTNKEQAEAIGQSPVPVSTGSQASGDSSSPEDTF